MAATCKLLSLSSVILVASHVCLCVITGCAVGKSHLLMPRLHRIMDTHPSANIRTLPYPRY